MGLVHEVEVRTRSVDTFAQVLDEDDLREFLALGPEMRHLLAGRVVWHVNTTAVGGGVAEMLRQQIAYTRGSGVDGRWLVISGPPEFFRITKRLHHALHGAVGDGSPLGETEHRVYEETMAANATEILERVRPGDIVQLHDPQTAGLAGPLIEAGAAVGWRCHVGTDTPNEETARGWEFLRRYLADVQYLSFSRREYVPDVFDPDRVAIVQPTIDAFSPKNWYLDERAVNTILAHIGVVTCDCPDEAYTFQRSDRTPGRVERRAEVIRLDGAPSWTTPLVVQVSRWDPLKDPVGVLEGFAHLVQKGGAGAAHLVLAGPDVAAVADDPEGALVLAEVERAWRALPDVVRGRVHLVSLPTADGEENAVMVNALQRHAAVVVQKSLQEGFGLTVTEAMWKGRPVLASSVGGIRDQIVDGVNGVLLEDPTDADEFAAKLGRLLDDREYAERLGRAAYERTRRSFLDPHAFRVQAEQIREIATDVLR